MSRSQTMAQKSIAWSVLTMSLLTPAPGIRKAHADSPPGYSSTFVQLAPQTCRNFEKALNEIASANKVTIITEGQPLHRELTEQDAEDVAEDLKAPTFTPVDDAVARIALAYDYEAVRVSPQEFLLRKRYTEPADLPCVTYGEVLHAMQQILRLTSAFALPDGPAVDFNSSEILYHSLSPEQKAKAEKSLTMADLTPDQRQLALTAIGDTTLGPPALEVKQIVDHLVALNDSSTVFTHMTVLDDVAAFGYRMRGGEKDGGRLFPLNNHCRINAAGWTHPFRRKSRPQIVSVGIPVEVNDMALGVDPALPTDEDRRLIAEMSADAAPEATTLADFTHTLVAGAAGNLHVSLAPGIGEKPISVFGAQYSTGDDLVRSVATLYQLQLLVPRKHDYSLVLPIEKDPTNAEGFHAELARLVPAPLARALARQRKLQSTIRQRSGNGVTPQNDYYYPAIRRLLLLATLAIPAPDSPPVPVIQVGLEALRLIAIALFAGDGGFTVQTLMDFQVPVYLMNPNSFAVSFKMRNEKEAQVLSAVFGYSDASGAFIPERNTIFMRARESTP